MAKTIFFRIYFPGLISLVFLPLLCIGYFMYKGQLSKWGMMNVACLDDESIKVLNMYGAKIHISDYEKFPVIEFSSNPVQNSKNLHDLVTRCNVLIKEHTYKKGVAVRFKDDATYKDWVGVLDEGFRLKVISFAPYKDKIYFFFLRPISWPKSPHPIDDVLPLYIDSSLPSSTMYDLILHKLEPLVSFWPSLIPFLLMVHFAIRSKRQSKVPITN